MKRILFITVLFFASILSAQQMAFNFIEITVEPNSIASGAGILEGDIIAYLDGKEVGVDGVMTSFCDQLNDWDFYTPLPFEVYRYVTDEFLEGELLGNRVESTSDILPPYFDVEVCPQSLQIGETYSFNFFVFEDRSSQNYRLLFSKSVKCFSNLLRTVRRSARSRRTATRRC